jgi:hypothetical protein
VGFAVFALLGVAAGSTLAGGGNPATLYACYDGAGNVRMSDVPQCKLPTGGRLVSWNTVGAAGPTGPRGDTGAVGATGPAGPAGGGGVTTRSFFVECGQPAVTVATAPDATFSFKIDCVTALEPDARFIVSAAPHVTGFLRYAGTYGSIEVPSPGVDQKLATWWTEGSIDPSSADWVTFNGTADLSVWCSWTETTMRVSVQTEIVGGGGMQFFVTY